MISHLSAFCGRPTKGVYSFHDPITSIKPVWTTKPFHPFIESKFVNSEDNTTYITIESYDSQKVLSKIEIGSLDRKSRFVIDETTIIKYDSLLMYQVFISKGDNYYAYDSTHFLADGTLDYNCAYFGKNEEGLKNKDNWNAIELTLDSANIRKYLTGNTVYVYDQRKPIRTYGLFYEDSIFYSVKENSEIAEYYYKSKEDSTFLLGGIDSLSNSMLIYEHRYERYFPQFNYRIFYHYNEDGQLVLKMNSQFSKYLVKDYYENGHIRKEVDTYHDKSNITNYIYRYGYPYKKK
jgi:hypothetical protein